MENIKLGQTHKEFLKVTDKVLAKNIGSGDVNVFATPMMICLMEKASTNCLKSFLYNDETSVGTSISVSHIAATPVDFEVYAESEIIEINDKKITFKIRAFDNCGLIGEGTHQRFIVNKEKFELKAFKKGE